MTDRAKLMSEFLDSTEWGTWDHLPMTGDASSRAYIRLLNTKTKDTVILMDAPPEKGEDVKPFVHIASFLTKISLSAPQIFAKDVENGFLILEDLGDDLFARHVERAPQDEKEIYTAAVDVLVELQRTHPPKDIPKYTIPVMTDLAALAYDWYAFGADQDGIEANKQNFSDAFSKILNEHANDTSVLAQRDYQSENLLWRPDQSGHARVGLLDFQDAVQGPPAYDLVSLLEDARRDVPLHIQSEMLDYFIQKTGRSENAFKTSYAVLGAQRNMRILGVFARLSLYYGKPRYVDLIPRVWGYLQQDLAAPELSEIRSIINTSLPEPTDDILNRLKKKCGTITSL